MIGELDEAHIGRLAETRLEAVCVHAAGRGAAAGERLHETWEWQIDRGETRRPDIRTRYGRVMSELVRGKKRTTHRLDE